MGSHEAPIFHMLNWAPCNVRITLFKATLLRNPVLATPHCPPYHPGRYNVWGINLAHTHESVSHTSTSRLSQYVLDYVRPSYPLDQDCPASSQEAVDCCGISDVDFVAGAVEAVQTPEAWHEHGSYAHSHLTLDIALQLLSATAH
jgi:hypothetical protein